MQMCSIAKTAKTDAILVVDGKKLHVNKTLLSYHSDYFDTLFNSGFKEKSMPEIEIKDVNFEKFATLLSLIQPKPIFPTGTVDNADKILELADRFLLPAAQNFMNMWLVSTTISRLGKLRLADKYKLPILTAHALTLFDSQNDLLCCKGYFKNYSDVTKARIYDRLASLNN